MRGIFRGQMFRTAPGGESARSDVVLLFKRSYGRVGFSRGMRFIYTLAVGKLRHEGWDRGKRGHQCSGRRKPGAVHSKSTFLPWPAQSLVQQDVVPLLGSLHSSPPPSPWSPSGLNVCSRAAWLRGPVASQDDCHPSRCRPHPAILASVGWRAPPGSCCRRGPAAELVDATRRNGQA
jgi:hypothetical protein